MASPFTDDEKRFVLAEIIKDSKTDVQPLVDFIQANCVKWNWLSVQVPTGRTVEQCIQATEEMFQGPIPAQNPTREPPRPGPHAATSSPAPAPVPPAPHSDPASGPSIQTLLSGPPQTPRASTPQHVAIQPRPPAGPAQQHPAERPTKRPRGRPSRQENLRHGGSRSARTLQRLAPLPVPGVAGLGQRQGQCQGQVQGQGTAGARAGSKASTASPSPSRYSGPMEVEPRGRKRARPPFDEMVIKTETNGTTPAPTPPAVDRVSPPAGREPEDGRDCAGPSPRRQQQRQHQPQHQHQHEVLETARRGPLGASVPVTS